MGKLYTRTWADCPLGPLLEAAAASLSTDNVAQALIYSPRFCAFGKLTLGKLEGPPELPQANGPFHDTVLAEAYELRLFTAAWEARWLRHGQTGQAALLWDEETGRDPTPPPWPLALAGTDGAIPFVGTLPQQYLLWGKRDDAKRKDGWTALTAARIGILWAPIPPGPADSQYVVLKACEYLVREKNHGNVVVCEQRLTGLAPYMPGTESEEAA